MEYELVDCCPVPKKLAPVIRGAKQKSGAILVSGYRGHDAIRLLRKCGKKSQRELYEGWVNRRPGYNPANPPGRSTHELRSDAVAYRGPAGRKLKWWQLGMDWTDSRRVVKAFNELGFNAHITYPNNPREGHHINLTRQPRKNKVARLFRRMFLRTLSRGSRGLDVYLLRTRLRRLGFTRAKGWKYTKETVRAVQRFQKYHHQKVDGIYGPQTDKQLKSSLRWFNKQSQAKRNQVRRENLAWWNKNDS